MLRFQLCQAQQNKAEITKQWQKNTSPGRQIMGNNVFG